MNGVAPTSTIAHWVYSIYELPKQRQLIPYMNVGGYPAYYRVILESVVKFPLI